MYNNTAIKKSSIENYKEENNGRCSIYNSNSYKVSNNSKQP